MTYWIEYEPARWLNMNSIVRVDLKTHDEKIHIRLGHMPPRLIGLDNGQLYAELWSAGESVPRVLISDEKQVVAIVKWLNEVGLRATQGSER